MDCIVAKRNLKPQINLLRVPPENLRLFSFKDDCKPATVAGSQENALHNLRNFQTKIKRDFFFQAFIKPLFFLAN